MHITITNPESYAILNIIVAFTQGGLLGLEREKAGVEQSEKDLKAYELPGVRTFGLISTLGAVTSILTFGKLGLPSPYSAGVFFVSAAFVLLLVSLYMYYRLFKQSTLGLTTYVVMVLTYIVGILTGLNHYVFSLGLTFLVSGVLASKKLVIKALTSLSYEEIAAGLELGIIVFILGPIALGTHYTFYGVSVSGAYLFFTLILAISYTSYLIYKVKGSESISVIGFLGGLINSEATLVNVLKLSPSDEYIVKSTIIVNSGLVLRTVLISLFGAAPFLHGHSFRVFSIVVLTGLLLVFLLFAIIYYVLKMRARGASERVEKVVIKSPLEYRTALRGAVIYVVLFIASKLASSIMGDLGVLGIAFIGGFASAGATVFSLLSLSSSLSPVIIGVGVLLSASSAFLNKIAYAKLVVDWSRVKKVVLCVVPPAILLLIVSFIFLTISVG